MLDDLGILLGGLGLFLLGLGVFGHALMLIEERRT